MKIALSSVAVFDRAREDLGDIQDLANSMNNPDIGQLQPIVVSALSDGRWKLEAGGRRFAAATLLGWKEIEASTKDQLTPRQSKRIEFEENFRRKAMSWQEDAKTVREVHAMSMEDDPEWSVDKTAAFMGVSRRTVYAYMELSDAIDKHEDIANADTPFAATKRLRHIKEIKNRQVAVENRRLAEEVGMVKKDPGTRCTIHLGKAEEYMAQREAESCDAVITNPPYGVEIEDLFHSGKRIYKDDTAKRIVDLAEVLVNEAYRILRPNRWFVIYWPTVYLEEMKGLSENLQNKIKARIAYSLSGVLKDPVILDAAINQVFKGLQPEFDGILTRAGFKFQKVPAIWVKPNKTQSGTNDPWANMDPAYESLYFCRKGDAKFHRLRKNDLFIFDTPKSDRIHPLQMPPEAWQAVLEMIVMPGEEVVEPCCGSGSGGVAAIRQRVHYDGIELDPEWASRAKMWTDEEKQLPQLAPVPTTPVEKAAALLESTPFDAIPF